MKSPSQTVGPYYAIGLSRRPQNTLADSGLAAMSLLLEQVRLAIADRRAMLGGAPITGSAPLAPITPAPVTPGAPANVV